MRGAHSLAHHDHDSMVVESRGAAEKKGGRCGQWFGWRMPWRGTVVVAKGPTSKNEGMSGCVCNRPWPTCRSTINSVMTTCMAMCGRHPTRPGRGQRDAASRHEYESDTTAAVASRCEVVVGGRDGTNGGSARQDNRARGQRLAAASLG